MTRRWMALAAYALPLIGLSAMWASTEQWHRQGTDWLVPVEGYDPRDLLRGHYVQFQYQWPGAELAQPDFDAPTAPEGYAFGACLVGSAPRLERVERLADEAARARCPHYLANEGSGIYGTPDLPRNGRLYVAQTAGNALERQLGDTAVQGMIRVRLREDGSVTPLELTFVPRAPERVRADSPASSAASASPPQIR